MKIKVKLPLQTIEAPITSVEKDGDGYLIVTESATVLVTEVEAMRIFGDVMRLRR
jgi:hypothetical protein